MSEARMAWANIIYNGMDVTEQLRGYLETFQYTDVADGESDTISIELCNLGREWISGFYPSHNDKLITKIITEHWNRAGKKNFYCGKFVVDDVSFSGRPLKCKIEAISSPASEAFKTANRTKVWKQVTVEGIGAEIAKKYGLAFSYEGSGITVKKMEQSEESDSDFYCSLCQKYGLGIKIFSNKIVVYDKKIYEGKPASIVLDETDMLSWEYNTTLTGTYTGAKIQYTDPETEKDTMVTVGSTKRLYQVNEKVDSAADAELIGAAEVNKANEQLITMSVTMMANTRVIATSTVTITGLNKLNGKYFVDKVTHSVGSGGYTMALEMHKIQKRIG